MATDIYNISGSTTGNQSLGAIRVGNPGGIIGGRSGEKKTDVEGVETPTVASISTKYDTRFDDPRYYSGDTIT